MSRPALPTFRRGALALWVVALAVGLALPGCARRRALALAAAPEPPTASPGLRGRAHGFELWVWVVSDPRPLPPEPEAPPEGEGAAPESGAAAAAPAPAAQPEEKPAPGTIKRVKPGKPPPVRYTVQDGRISLEQALRPYQSRDVPAPYEARARWRANGLRLVAIPPEDLPLLESVLRMVGPVQRQWLGEFPAWTDLIRSGPLPEGPVTGDDSVVRLEAGRIRLLGRGWAVPADIGSGSGGGLRLELVPQHQPRQSDAQKFAAALEPPKPAEAQGVNFGHLAMGMTITGSDALAIVCDSPRANWNEDPEASGADPEPLSVPTIGERMLSTPGSPGVPGSSGTAGTPRTRAVLILVPHVREKYSILP